MLLSSDQHHHTETPASASKSTWSRCIGCGWVNGHIRNEVMEANRETGSFTQTGPHESNFVGSSSGIYFINTVKQAFELSARHDTSQHLPGADDIVGGEDDFVPSARNALTDRNRRHTIPDLAVTLDEHGSTVGVTTRAQLGSLPSYELAQQHAISYFEVWHPVVPFLSGPQFLQDLETFYQHRPIATLLDRQRQCYMLMFSCVLSMGACCKTARLPQTSVEMPSPSHLLSLVAALAARHDILTIQTVLAAQIYCVSTMALRIASSLGGILTRLLYHAGLHRCPHRYPRLSSQDRELRKRILWSAYAMDRYVCQALGVPVSLVNAEIDVCVPGRQEIHDVMPSRAAQSHLTAPLMAKNEGSKAPQTRELVLANLVEHAGLVGRALELFHVSIHRRTHDARQILFLRSDVDKWYNSLPEEPDLTSGLTTEEEQTARFLPFFHVLYEQLIIAINRPSLSLPRSTAEFHHGLQTTIRAAKRTINALERHSYLFWPGYVAAVWMSGLIISFGCQIGQHDSTQGSQEISRCLALLTKMSERWRSAQRCHAALSTLLSELTKPQHKSDVTRSQEVESSDRPKKRSRPNSTASETATVGARANSPVQPISSNTSVLENNQAADSAPSPTTWDGSDFFWDLSWNNLFDIDDMESEPNFDFLPR